MKLYTAHQASGSISLNQLHEECHSRIRYVKTCPIHGEVSNDEIVSGYQIAKDQYVVIDPDELDQLRTESDKAISVSTFVRADEVERMYDAGRTYYVVPDGPVGEKAYALIRDAMQEEGLHAIAQVVLAKREQLMLLRPVGKLLVMTDLHTAAEVREPETFEDEVANSDYQSRELELTKQLMAGLKDEKFDLADFPDAYIQKLKQLIEAKAAGEELVAPPEESVPEVINLMDALKASVKQVATPEKPARKMAGSRKERAAKKARRRKSG